MGYLSLVVIRLRIHILFPRRSYLRTAWSKNSDPNCFWV